MQMTSVRSVLEQTPAVQYVINSLVSIHIEYKSLKYSSGNPPINSKINSIANKEIWMIENNEFIPHKMTILIKFMN